MNVLLMASLLALLTPGLYRTAAGTATYVGVEYELPDPPVNQSYDPVTKRFVESPRMSGLQLVTAIREQRTTVETRQGRLGVSLYYTDAQRRAAVVLIHGNDAETREMGFLIPYFVVQGINVISYDQRGTGTSVGNWQMSGPVQRAADVDALVDVFATNKLVDPKRIGVWGFSNGGWTAPIVAKQRPVAFMILKSAPAESLQENILFEAKQRMLRYHQDVSSMASALETWLDLLNALCDDESWDAAIHDYHSAEQRSWFAYSLLPPNLHLPLQGAVKVGYRNFACYDPAQTLTRVRTPTLALFGARDRAVDVQHASRTFSVDFAKAGMTDFTMHLYGGAGHTLVISGNGFAPDVPMRYAQGYPEIMIDWLAHRGFLIPSEPR